jgi:nucleotide-binding universal stress UspA family protein
VNNDKYRRQNRPERPYSRLIYSQTLSSGDLLFFLKRDAIAFSFLDGSGLLRAKEKGKMKMAAVKENQGKHESEGPTVLVAVDFSHCSKLALRQAKSWASRNNGKVLVLHVIDQDFVRHCIQQHLGVEEEVKKKLFINSKNRLRRFLRSEGMDEKNILMIVSEGRPCIEINRKAVENDVEMIIMGSKGDSDDMKAIFFGSTAERVLRFIKRPVLCIPEESNYNLK